MQGSAHFAPSQRRIGGIGFAPSPLGVDRHDAVDWLIELVDASKEIVGGFAAGNLLLTNLPRDGDRAGVGKFGHVDVLPISLICLSVAHLSKKSTKRLARFFAGRPCRVA